MTGEPRLWFLGDICLTDAAEDRCLAEPEYRALAGLAGVVAEGDAVVGNIEYAISDRGERVALKYAALRASPGTLGALRGLSVGILGNNHIGDYGHEAARDTVDHLRASGLQTAGYGRDLRQASGPAVVELGGARVAIVAFCCPTTNAAAYADPYSPGVAPLTPDVLRPTIEAAKREHDLVVAYMHWGDEQEHYPVLDQMRLGRRAVDWGADAVVGCHAHVIQPYEEYRGRWIFHGLGNFIFPDVPWTNVRPDGTVDKGLHKQRPANRESLAVGLCPVRGRDGWSLRLDQVVAFRHGEDFTPRRTEASALTVDLEGHCRRLGLLAKRVDPWLHDSGFQWRTFYEGSQFVHRYTDPPVDRDVRARRRSLPRRAASRLLRTIEGLSGAGEGDSHRRGRS